MLQIAKNFVYLELVILAGWIAFYSFLQSDQKKLVGHYQFIVVSIINFILFFCPSLLLLHIAVFLLPVLVVRSRVQLITVMIVGTLGMPALLIDLTVSSVNLIRWTLQATLGLGGLVALLSTQRDRDAQRSALNLSLILFLTLSIAIAVRATSPTNWLRQILAVVCAYGVPVLVIGACVKSDRTRQGLMTALAGVGAMLAAIMTYESRVHWPLYVSLYTKYNISLTGLVVKYRGGAMRAYGPLDEATAAGFALVITLVAALASGAIFKRGPARFAVPLIIAIGILAPQSRGGMVGAAVAIMAFAFYRYGWNGMAKVGALLSPVAAIYVLRGQLAASKLQDAQDTSEYRKQLFTRGVQEFWHRPLLGDTFDHVFARLADMRQGEGIVDLVNSYLYFALLAGIVGLVLFCTLLFYPIGHLAVIRKTVNRHLPTSSFAAFAFAALLSASVMLAFTSIPQRPIIVTLVVAGAALALRRPLLSRRPSGLAVAQVQPGTEG